MTEAVGFFLIIFFSFLILSAGYVSLNCNCWVLDIEFDLRE